MPKRARCPHCDRLFNRDMLDDHIRRCRARRSVDKDQSRVQRRRVLVIDGNNVAYYLSPDGRPHVSNLVASHRSITSAGFSPVFVISAALQHKIDDVNGLHSFMSAVRVVKAAAGTDDDLQIIKTAQKLNADIVTNDRFLNWIDRYPWIVDRLRKYRMTPRGLILL